MRRGGEVRGRDLEVGISFGISGGGGPDGWDCSVTAAGFSRKRKMGTN